MFPLRVSPWRRERDAVVTITESCQDGYTRLRGAALRLQRLCIFADTREAVAASVVQGRILALRDLFRSPPMIDLGLSGDERAMKYDLSRKNSSAAKRKWPTQMNANRPSPPAWGSLFGKVIQIDGKRMT